MFADSKIYGESGSQIAPASKRGGAFGGRTQSDYAVHQPAIPIKERQDQAQGENNNAYSSNAF